MERRPYGFFSNMNNKQLLEYVSREYGEDISPVELEKKDSSLYEALRIKKLTCKLKFKKRPRGFLREMSNREILDYTFKEHGRDISPCRLDKKDQSLYSELCKRKLTKKLKMKRRPNGLLRSMRDDELFRYAFEEYGEDISPSELYKKEGSLYVELLRRKLTKKLKFKMRPMRILKNMNKRQLLKYTFKEYGGDISPSELSKKDPSLYVELLRRKLTKKLEHIIKPGGYYKDFKNFKNDMWKAIEENNWEFPTFRILHWTKRHSLNNAIQRYYGGFYAVAEKIGYNEAKRMELAKQLEEIVNELD